MPDTEQILKKCLEHICREEKARKDTVLVFCPGKLSVVSLDWCSIYMKAQRVKEVCKKKILFRSF